MASSLTYDMNNIFLDENYILVAGIDFGTTYSAYAFSFKSSQDEIRMNKNWGASVGCESYKAPTCVLTKPNGDFHSFGYDAENDFSQLEEEEVSEDGYNLYRHFKMLLHNKGMKMASNISSTSGHVRPAMDIFSMALGYLKDHMIAAIQQAVESPPSVSMIRWVITVPAIWTDASKRFMRQAAYKAGLITEVDSKKLMIALEPEAASIFCRGLELNHFISGPEETTDVTFKTGQKVMIIDAGGGTIDITAHEMIFDGEVKEIIPPSGGPWGGIKVDEKFITLLKNVLGADFINKFKAENANEWLGLLLSFERAKKSVGPASDRTKGSIKVPLSWALGTSYSNFSGKSIDKVIKSKSKFGVSFNNGSLIIDQPTTLDLFESVINDTVSHVKNLLRDARLSSLNYILLVGGFGECQFLQQACLENFSHQYKVLIPLSAQLAIIKGAVMFGHRPGQISSRITKLTYGCSTNEKFDESKHDPGKKNILDGEEYCAKSFKKFVTKGDTVKVAFPYTYQFQRPKKDTALVSMPIHSTEKMDPMYVDEPGVTLLEEITLKSSRGPLGLDLEIRVTFGGTEILVEARDKSKGEDFHVSTTVTFASE